MKHQRPPPPIDDYITKSEKDKKVITDYYKYVDRVSLWYTYSIKYHYELNKLYKKALHVCIT